MDPNIMKFLEEDEDETMHSGADVDAFTAELNRDIEGNSPPSHHLTDSNTVALSQGSGQTASQFLSQWQTSGHDEIANLQTGQDMTVMEQMDQHSSQFGLQRQGSDSLNPKEEHGFSHELNSIRFPDNSSMDAHPDLQDNQNIFGSSQPLSMQTSGEQPVLVQNPDNNTNQNMSSQQSMAIGSNNQQPNDQKPFLTGKGNQQTSMGISNSQGMAVAGQHATGTGMYSEQSMTSGMRNQESMTSSLQQQGTSLKSNKQVPFGMLLPIIQPQLDKDRAMQLQTLYVKLKKNEIMKDDFVRHMRSIVGDQMLKMAVYKLQIQQVARNTQPPANQLQSQLQSQASARQLQLSSTSQMPTDLTNPSNNANIIRSRELENQADSKTSIPMYASSGISYQPFSGKSVASSTPLRPQIHGPQFRQTTAHQSMSFVKQEPVDQSNEQPKTQMPSAMGSSSQSLIKPGNATPGNSMDESFDIHSSRMGFTSITGMALPRKPVVGQKKPMEAPGSSPPSSKKQKVAGGFLDQSIEQLNDVTAVSGVNLREEEEQLFSGSKEESRVSEASRRVVQEEEEKLILQKIPLQKKVVEIMAKSGLKSMSNDVERCLSLCVEERMRGLITNLIRLSKQRIDMEKPRHRTIITSDIKQQISTINRKAREELEKKQAENEKSQKPTDSENSGGADGDKDKDEARAKSAKANKEEDDKMRATAANVAVRAATGVGDMLSKWQLMIEAKQKQGGSDSASGSHSGKDVKRKSSSTSRNTRESQEAEKRDPSTALNTPASGRKAGRNQAVGRRVSRSITVKDVIALLEREPQMSRSALIYRLYDKASAAAATE